MAVRLVEAFTHEETVNDYTMDRIKDMISDLECNVTTTFAYDPALRFLERKENMPPDSLDGSELDDIGLFDEQADMAFAIGRKLILAALVEMNWLEENESWINVQKIKKDLKDA